jgi:phosphatidate cytidylyltransferase
MTRRVLTAVPLAALVVYIILQTRQWPFVLAVTVTAEICLFEFFAISRNTGLKGLTAFGYIAAAALCGAQVAELHGASGVTLMVLLLIVVLILFLALLRSNGLKDYLGTAASTLLGVLYVGFGLSWLIRMRFSEPATGRLLTILLLLMIWADDIFAYIVGRTLGKTALASRISPKKTIEGSVAGLAGTVLVTWGFMRLFWKPAGIQTVLLLSLPVAAAGQLGDLIESALKRGAEMKDSGHLLPGHGGMLDRVDSLLLGAPVFWFVWELDRLWHR